MFLVLVAVMESRVVAQKTNKGQELEQTRFGAEEGVRKPVEIPAGALQVLRDTLSRGPLNCIKGKGTTSEQVPASWFAASEIHLEGQEETDLIVLPNVLKIAAHELPPAAGCLLGANVGPFWVLRRNTSGRYGLLLETYAQGLDVLDSRTNFYRDIQTGTATPAARTTALYKMDVPQYQIAEKKTEPQFK